MGGGGGKLGVGGWGKLGVGGWAKLTHFSSGGIYRENPFFTF